MPIHNIGVATQTRLRFRLASISSEEWNVQYNTVKWGNTVIGINIVTSLPKFMTND
jgi:hypothetical protein